MRILCALLNIYIICMFGRIILSWFPVSSGGALATINDLLRTITEPLLAPLRRILPSPRMGPVMLDLSPLVLLLVLQLVVAPIVCG